MDEDFRLEATTAVTEALAGVLTRMGKEPGSFRHNERLLGFRYDEYDKQWELWDPLGEVILCAIRFNDQVGAWRRELA